MMFITVLHRIRFLVVLLDFIFGNNVNDFKVECLLKQELIAVSDTCRIEQKTSLITERFSVILSEVCMFVDKEYYITLADFLC